MQDDQREKLASFLKEEAFEQLIVQSPNSGAAIFSLQSETADWIKQRKAIVVLKLMDKIGLDNDTDMQNEITEEMMGDVLIFMELTK
jgi:hypothetical protein